MREERTLRAQVVRLGELDREIADLPWIVFVRQDGSLFVRCPAPLVVEAVAALARAGVETGPSAIDPRSPALRPAIVTSLAPLASRSLVDTVFVRTPPLGEAIDLVRARTRSLFRRRARERRAETRLLLRDEDRMLSWTRVIWADADLLRSGRVPDARPVVFDPGGLGHVREHIAYTRSAELARWAAA